MPDLPSRLPVETVLPALRAALADAPAVILQAPPGSGKTTRVPPALLEAPWLGGQRILMLEPRRLAATSAAHFMAARRGEPVGATIGYTIRYQQRRSASTRLEVLTEGLLTRRLQADPELTGVGLVIFDEFHERSLQADLALALCRDVQSALRADLRLLVMSATLDSAPLARLLGDCPVVTAAGRSFPVTIDHLPQYALLPAAEATAAGVRHALAAACGDILAFLPGAGEIARCGELLHDLADTIDLRPLHGSLRFADQEAAIVPGPRRRVVLATNVAETSLTIEGIGVVVDSGWEKRPRFDPGRGSTRLEATRISRASAEQRTGRAGRLGPGQCYRLWSAGTEGAMLPFTPAEIRQADLAPLAFELTLWGITDPAQLAWLDPPAAGPMAAARQLLTQLGAVDEGGRLTSTGRQMSRYPTHPRLARLLLAALEEGCADLGCDLVALLGEREPSGDRRQPVVAAPCDLLPGIERLRNRQLPQTAAIQRAAADWRRRTGANGRTPVDARQIARLLARAWPDRLGVQRSPASRRYLLRSGQGATLASTSQVHAAEWLVAIEIAGQAGGDGEIRLASRLDPSTVEELFGHAAHWQREAGWDERADRVVVRETRRLGAIVLQERPVDVTVDDTVPALLALLRRKGLDALPWTPHCRQFQARADLLHRHLAERSWPDFSASALLVTLEDWLAPWLAGVTTRRGLQTVPLEEALAARLGWNRLKELDRLAPERLEVPSGSRIRIDYLQGEQPVLAVKLQEMFGLAETPRLVDGRVSLLVHLLSPAGRPLAITGDLRHFWQDVYPEVQKEMRGRYPKHPWPDNPWQARATRRTGRQ
ncbi:MAG: ATP-dependent helicase HrpB [Desulfuromonadales bacterium]|nr:ATP-dependent helicase HrpB [Desulfuromonadales bacterium]